MCELALGESANSSPQDFMVEAIFAAEVIIDGGLVHPCFGNNGAYAGLFITACSAGDQQKGWPKPAG
jgi:hypothetical protein